MIDAIWRARFAKDVPVVPRVADVVALGKEAPMEAAAAPLLSDGISKQERWRRKNRSHRAAYMRDWRAKQKAAG